MSSREAVTWLAEALDPDQFLAFLVRFGGEVIYLPRAAALLRDARDQALRREHRDGADYLHLARRYRLHVRTVRRIADEKKVA